MARPNEVSPSVRASILIVGLLLLTVGARVLTDSWIPRQPMEALVFQTVLLGLVLSVSVSELNFTKPSEAVVNSLTAGVSVLAVAPEAPKWPTLALIAYLAVVFAAGVVCVFGQRTDEPNPSTLHSSAYLISSQLGRARVVFSIVLIVVVVYFVDNQTAVTSALLAFWAVLLALWPLSVPQWLSRWGRASAVTDRGPIGVVTRIDSPGVARVQLTTRNEWHWGSEPVLVDLPDRSVLWAVPLFSEFVGDERWGTMLVTTAAEEFEVAKPGTVRALRAGESAPSVADLLERAFGVKGELLGFVQDGTSVSRLEFEALPGANLRVGMVLAIATDDGDVYYQVTDGMTQEERFAGLTYGSHRVHAVQIGRLDGSEFRRHHWVPKMNAPVFLADLAESRPENSSEFVLGAVAGTGLDLRGNFVDRLDSHTALLGMTGTGKTEFAFDLIRHATDNGVKVICIDLTAQYVSRLPDAQLLSIDSETSAELGAKLFDAETGKFGAGDEKKALAEFAGRLRDEVEQRLAEFLRGGDQIGLIELDEISNSKATLFVTELYLSVLLNLARTTGLPGKVLVVVEEAHTVMPEVNFIASGDYAARGTVAKIAQVALQGRKYGVGLLVIAQRTANVSKSVLTQCNTVIAFRCVDDTSIDFLSGMLGRPTAEGLKNTGLLRAVAHGDWIRSETPLTFEIPYSADKAAIKFAAPAAVPVPPGTEVEIEWEPPF